MAFRNGGSPPQRVDAAGTRSKAISGKSPSPSRKNGTTQAHYSVTAGRVTLGTIEMVDGIFTAITPEGVVVGEFGSLREAAATLPNGGER